MNVKTFDKKNGNLHERLANQFEVSSVSVVLPFYFLNVTTRKRQKQSFCQVVNSAARV